MKGLDYVKAFVLGIGGVAISVIFILILIGAFTSPKVLNGIGINNSSATYTAITSTTSQTTSMIGSAFSVLGVLVGLIIIVVLIAVFGIKFGKNKGFL